MNVVKTIWADFKSLLVQVRNCLCLQFLFHRKIKELEEQPKVEPQIAPEDELTELMSFSLEEVKDFLEEFIGIAIVGFQVFEDEIEDLDEQVSRKIISGVDLKDQTIWIKLSKFNGRDGGYLKVVPSIVGEFAAIGMDDEIMEQTLYRINFFGGSCLEYLDRKTEGVISYHERKEK